MSMILDALKKSQEERDRVSEDWPLPAEMEDESRPRRPWRLLAAAVIMAAGLVAGIVAIKFLGLGQPPPVAENAESANAPANAKAPSPTSPSQTVKVQPDTATEADADPQPAPAAAPKSEVAVAKTETPAPPIEPKPKVEEKPAVAPEPEPPKQSPAVAPGAAAGGSPQPETEPVVPEAPQPPATVEVAEDKTPAAVDKVDVAKKTTGAGSTKSEPAPEVEAVLEKLAGAGAGGKPVVAASETAPQAAAVDREAETLAAAKPPRKPAARPRMKNVAVVANRAVEFSRRGQAFEAQGLAERAIEEYTKATLEDPAYVPAYVGLGWSHDARGNHRAAVRSFTEAIDLGGPMADAYFGRAWANEQIGNAAAAVEDYSRVIDIEPGHLQALFSRGVLSLYDGHPDRAAGDFGAITRSGEAAVLGEFSRLWLFVSQMRAGKGLAALPEKTGVTDALAGALISLFRGEGEEINVLTAVERRPGKKLENECIAYFFLGQYHLALGEKEAAEDYFRRTIATGVKHYRQYAAAERELERLSAGE